MNKAILIGNLTRDPETRTTASGVTMCQFTIAVNRRYVNQQGVREADFIPIVAWRQTAELCSRYLSKGRKSRWTASFRSVPMMRRTARSARSPMWWPTMWNSFPRRRASGRAETIRRRRASPACIHPTPTPLPMWTTSCRSEASAPSFKEENSNV